VPRLSSNFTISLFDVFTLRVRGIPSRIFSRLTFERSVVVDRTDVTFGMSKTL